MTRADRKTLTGVGREVKVPIIIAYIIYIILLRK